jgi:formiminotetrahydrofolate cyclodeaminase
MILTEVEQFFPQSNKRVFWELVGSANMAKTAAASAKHGVKINLSFRQDEIYKEHVWNTVRKSYQKSTEMKQRIDRFINGL